MSWTCPLNYQLSRNTTDSSSVIAVCCSGSLIGFSRSFFGRCQGLIPEQQVLVALQLELPECEAE
jgi:hypothetical protein